MMTDSSIPFDETVSAYLHERVALNDFPSAVYLVAEQGRVMLADAIGDAVRQPQRHAATIETIYDLASLTKPLVTGLLLALMSERRQVRLDDPVAHHIAEFSRDDKRDITVRQLATHTSGLPAWRQLAVLTEGERARACQVIAAQALDYAPGTRVVYSDLGFITLGWLLEKIAGAGLAQIARREIFEPLQLRRTYFNPPASIKSEMAASESDGNAYERGMCKGDVVAYTSPHWRTRPIWGEVHDGNAFFLGGAAGHAGLFSTAAEVLWLAEQFIANRSELLAPETCAQFRANMTEGLNEARSLGWQLAKTTDSAAGAALAPDSFGHLGFTGTSCWIVAANERIYILLTNRTHDHTLPFVNINGVRRMFHTLATDALVRSVPGAARDKRAMRSEGGIFDESGNTEH